MNGNEKQSSKEDEAIHGDDGIGEVVFRPVAELSQKFSWGRLRTQFFNDIRQMHMNV
jgi:hypothetical protein